VVQGELPRLLEAAREAQGALRSSLRTGAEPAVEATLAEQHAMMQDVSFFLVLCGWLAVILWALIFMFLLGMLQQ
jgi:hypothetical protein